MKRSLLHLFATAVLWAAVGVLTGLPTADSGESRNKNPSAKTSPSERLTELLNEKGFDPKGNGLVVLKPSGSGAGAAEARTLFEYNPDTPLKTASVMKVFTTAAALHFLKPEYRFKTVFGSDREVKKGVLDGDLAVQAGGDPFLTPERMILLISEMKRAGLTRAVTGDLWLDLSRYEGPLRPDTWPADQLNESYAAPICPLSFAFNSVTLHIRAGEETTTRPEILVSPNVPYVRIVNKIEVIEKGKPSLGLQVTDDGREAVIEVTGRILKKDVLQSHVSIHHGEMLFASALIEQMKREGIDFKGKIYVAPPPFAPKPLFTHSSLPLADLITSINVYSNNVMTELLLRELGGVVIGLPGSTEKGVLAVRRYLEAEGLDPKDLSQIDGSGLSRENRATPRLTARTLFRLSQRFDIGPEFVSSLAVTGGDGVLRRHPPPQTFYRQLRGKSGIINGVMSFTGYLLNRKGEVLVVSVFLTDFSTTTAKALEQLDSIFEVLKEMD